MHILGLNNVTMCTFKQATGSVIFLLFFLEREREGGGVLLKHYPAHSVSKFANSF